MDGLTTKEIKEMVKTKTSGPKRKLGVRGDVKMGDDCEMDPVQVLREEIAEINTDEELDRIEEALDRLHNGKGNLNTNLGVHDSRYGNSDVQHVFEAINEDGVLTHMDVTTPSPIGKAGNHKMSGGSTTVTLEFEVPGL